MLSGRTQVRLDPRFGSPFSSKLVIYGHSLVRLEVEWSLDQLGRHINIVIIIIIITVEVRTYTVPGSCTVEVCTYIAPGSCTVEVRTAVAGAGCPVPAARSEPGESSSASGDSAVDRHKSFQSWPRSNATITS